MGSVPQASHNKLGEFWPIPSDRAGVTESGLEMMTWKQAARGNIGGCYLQIGFGFARAVRMWMADARKHLSLIPKVACLNPEIESCFGYFS